MKRAIATVSFICLALCAFCRWAGAAPAQVIISAVQPAAVAAGAPAALLPSISGDKDDYVIVKTTQAGTDLTAVYSKVTGAADASSCAAYVSGSVELIAKYYAEAGGGDPMTTAAVVHVQCEDVGACAFRCVMQDDDLYAFDTKFADFYVKDRTAPLDGPGIDLLAATADITDADGDGIPDAFDTCPSANWDQPKACLYHVIGARSPLVDKYPVINPNPSTTPPASDPAAPDDTTNQPDAVTTSPSVADPTDTPPATAAITSDAIGRAIDGGGSCSIVPDVSPNAWALVLLAAVLVPLVRRRSK